jgi:tetratricopeptide (TPR) repeat protein
MAEGIAGASIHDLVRLTRKSMLRITTKGRYEVHELLRQFAAEKLARDAAAERNIRKKHSQTYCQKLAVWERDLQGTRQVEAIQEIKVEIDNIRSAWNWAVENMRVKSLLGAINGLCLCYSNLNLDKECEAICRSLVESVDSVLVSDILKSDFLEEGSAVHIDSLKLKARALALAVFFNTILGNFDRADQLIQDCLSAVEMSELAGQDTRFEKAIAYLALSANTTDDSSEEARSLAEKAMQLFMLLEEPSWVRDCLSMLGLIADSISEEKLYWGQALEISRMLGDLQGISLSLEDISYAYASMFQFGRAEEMLFEALAISKELDNRILVAAVSGTLGWQWVWQGRFEEARSLICETLTANRDLVGFSDNVEWGELCACLPDLYLGTYEAARSQVQHAIELFGDLNHFSADNGIAMAREILGRIGLA